MSAKCFVTLFFVVVFVLFNASIDAKQQYNQTIDNDSRINISFRSLMPTVEKDAYFDCGVGTFLLPSKETHIMAVSTDKVVSCLALWKLFEANISAFDPQIDLKLGHPIVYWQIRANGFFHSLDNFFFERKTIWKSRK
jgi:hypothetical protein